VNNKAVPVLCLFALAFVVRLVFVVQWNALPYAAAPLLDAQVYDVWAKAIAHGDLLRGKAFYQSPLYPYLCGLLYAVFGHSTFVIGFLNALLGAACVAVLTGLSLLWFGLPAALVTGALGSFYRPFIFFSAPLMKEPLALFLLTLFVGAMYRALKGNRIRDYVAGGLALGLCVLVRGNVLLFAPVILAVGAWRYRAAFLKPAAAFVLALLLCIAPATLHNYVVSGDFVPVNYTDGFNLYIGNSPLANGTNQYPPEVSTDPVQEELNTIWVATQAAGHPLKPSEVSAYWRDRALAYMVENPSRVLVLMKNKVLAFWNSAETFDNYDAKFIEKNFGTILVLPLPEYWLITFLAAIGAVCLWPRRRGVVLFLVGFSLIYMMTLAVFYVTDRYRLPVVVFLLPLAGAAVPAFYDQVKQANAMRVAAALLCGAFFLFLGLRPDPFAVDLTAFNWGTLSMIYSDMERDQDALAAFDKAVASSPVQTGASAYVRASYALEHAGRDADAEKVLLRAIGLFPDDGIVRYNYGRYLAARSRLPEAMDAFEKGAELSPHYLLSYYALAKGYALRGDPATALMKARQGLALDPSDPLLNDILRELH